MNSTRALTGYHAANRLLLSIETRAFEDAPTPEELVLEEAWHEDLLAILFALYLFAAEPRHGPFPRTSEADLRQHIARVYASNDSALIPLLFSLRVGLRQSVNLGGQAALDLLGLPGAFALTNQQLLDRLDAWALELVTQGTPLSLLDTTIDDITALAWPLLQDGKTDAEVRAALDTYARQRSDQRATLISVSEESRGVAAGLVWVYMFNGVQTVRFTVREGACEICKPHAGEEYAVNAIPAALEIPLHVLCRCIWQAVLDAWQPPVVIWTGGTV